MKAKTLIVLAVGLGVGYVFGTRAGREKYNQMKDAATKLWNDPRVQRGVDTASDFVKEKAPEVADFVTENARKVATRVQRKKPASADTQL